MLISEPNSFWFSEVQDLHDIDALYWRPPSLLAIGRSDDPLSCSLVDRAVSPSDWPEEQKPERLNAVKARLL